MFNKMLVPLDGSKISVGVLPWVSAIARSLDIPVELLSIIDPDAPPLAHQVTSPGVVRYEARLPFLSFAADEQHYTGLPAESARGDLPTAPSRYQYDYADHHPQSGDVKEMAGVEEWLRERGSLLRHQGVNVLGETVQGAQRKPSEAILQFAEEHGCDLIAMASHDRNLLEQVFKGSVTSEVIRSSRVPIIAMTPERMPETPDPDQPVNVSSLSVLLDGSEFAEAVLPYAKDLASRLSLEIVLMRWLSGEQLDLDLVGTGNEPPDIDVIRSQTGQAIPEEAKEAIQYLRDKTSELLAEGFSARWEIPRMTADSVQDELMQGSARNMIVLASHGRSGIFRWLEGSVAEELLKEPGEPLLIIPPAVAQHQELGD